MEKRQNRPGRDIFGCFLLGISVLMLGKSLALCFSGDIWYDELFTVGMIKHSYSEIVFFTAADVHPPLYYCIVKLFVDLCKLLSPQTQPVIVAKIVSVLPYFILLLYSVTLIRRKFGLFVGGMLLFCVIAMPQLAAYTVEVRMYSWALLFVTAAFLHAYALTDNYVNLYSEPGKSATDTDCKKVRSLHGAAFVLYGLAAAYTQYFACVAVVMVYLYVLLIFWFGNRRRIREWLVWVGLSVAGYVPWLFVLYGQITAVRENYWILPLTFRSLGGCVKFLMKPAFADDRLNTVLAVVLFAVYLSAWAYNVSKLYHNGREKEKSAKNREHTRFFFATAGVCVPAGLVLFGFVASWLVRPIFVYRYMIPALGCFWLCFALCLDNMLCKSKCLRHGVVSLLGMVFTMLAVIVGLRNYRAFMGEEEYKSVCMKETENALSMIGQQDMILYNFDQVQAVTSYYLPETVKRSLWRVEGEKLIQEITSPCGIVEETDEIKEMLSEAKAEKDGADVWFIGSFNSRDDIVAEWQREGLVVEETGSFLLERYWFNLYKISVPDHTTL